MGSIIKDNKLLLAIGQLSIFLGLVGFITNALLFSYNPYISFMTGLLTGLALVLNLAYLFRLRRRVM